MPKRLDNPKEAILKEAKKILVHDGIQALNIRDIAKRCNIGTGTFYNYFATKNDLVLAVFRQDWQLVNELIDQLAQSELTFKEKLKKIEELLKEFVGAYLDLFFELSTFSGSHGCTETHKFDQLYHLVSKMIDDEKAKGTITNPLDSTKLAEFIISNILYLNRHHYMSFDELYNNFNL